MNAVPEVRGAVEYVRENLGKELICAEIGVREGLHTLGMLTLPIKQLYLVDFFLPYLDGETEQTVEMQSLHYRNVIELILSDDRLFEKTTLITKESKEASTLFPDQFFDFVYIDANHDYYYIKRDLELWWPKVKDTGGVLAGHDFDQVAKAVIDFTTNHALKLIFRNQDWVLRRYAE